MVCARVISRPFSRLVQIAPQQYVVPSTVRAQVRASPAEIDATGEGMGTCTMAPELVFVPSPNWPRSFAPQQNATPSVRTAHVCEKPALICVQPSVVGTITALEPPAASPPSCP